jgi:hypothetical protein
MFRRVYYAWENLRDDPGQLIYDWSDVTYRRIITAIEGA